MYIRAEQTYDFITISLLQSVRISYRGIKWHCQHVQVDNMLLTANWTFSRNRVGVGSGTDEGKNYKTAGNRRRLTG